jgi:Transposase.
MKQGSISLSCRQKDSPWNGNIQLHLRRSLRLSKKSHGHHFWDAEGVILVDIIPHGQITNSDMYIQTLKTLQKLFRRVQPHKCAAKNLLQCDNAQPHTSFKTQQTITELGWTVLSHPPYRPDLAPSDFNLFAAL